MTARERAAGARFWQLALLAAVLLAGALRWQDDVLEPQIKPDEVAYVRAAELWSSGRSPYEERVFFYPPFFAWTAAQLSERFGTLGYLEIQRASNLLGISLAIWLSLLIARWRPWPALAVGVSWVCLSPSVALSVELGNATGVPTALTLTGLWLWARRPHSAGLALGLAQLLKPIAPLAPVALLVHRKGANPRSAGRAGLVSLGVASLLLVIGWRYLPGILSNVSGSLHPYNFSCQRILAGFGLHLRPVWLTAIIGGAGLAWIHQRRFSRIELLIVISTLNLLAAPILWAHSLLLVLPVQLLAAGRLWRHLRSFGLRSPKTSITRRVLPELLAGLALASTLLGASIGGLADSSQAIQSMVLTAPYLSLLYLAFYALEEFDGSEDARRLPSQSA